MSEVKVLEVSVTTQSFGFGKPQTVNYPAAVFPNGRVAVDQGDDVVTVYVSRELMERELSKVGTVQVKSKKNKEK